MNRPFIGFWKKKEKEETEAKKIHPKQCPKCGSKNIMGYGLVSGWGYVELDTMNVDMSTELDLEIGDEESLDYVCMDCGNEWN